MGREIEGNWKGQWMKIKKHKVTDEGVSQVKSEETKWTLVELNKIGWSHKNWNKIDNARMIRVKWRWNINEVRESEG